METTATNDIDTKLSTLAEAQEKTSDMIAKLASAVTNFLSGQSSTAPAQAPARKRGRPSNAQKAAEAVAAGKATANTVPKEVSALHPKALEILRIVNQKQRVKIADVSKQLNENRANIFHFVRPLEEQGKVVVRRTWARGLPNDILYRPDRVLFRD